MTVPFDHVHDVSYRNWRGNGEFVEFINIPASQAAEAEEYTEIGAMYAEWLHHSTAECSKGGQRETRIPPKLSEFQPRGVNISLFNVAQTNPYDYTFQTTETPDSEPAQIIGMRKIEPEMIRNQLMIDLLNARKEYKVTYQQIYHRFSLPPQEEAGPMEKLKFWANTNRLSGSEPVVKEIVMRRLLLPVMNDDNEVNWVYSVARNMGIVNIEFAAAEWSA